MLILRKEADPISFVGHSLVDRAGHWANPNELTDFIGVFAIPRNVKPATIADLYLKQRLTASQVAAEVGISKSAVLDKLHSLDINRETIRDVANNQPRPAIRAPFRKSIVAGKLVTNRQELKTAQLIVELRARQALSWKEVVDLLKRENLKTRNGLNWKVGTAKMVFKKWNGKF